MLDAPTTRPSKDGDLTNSAQASSREPSLSHLGRERWLFHSGLLAFGVVLAFRRLGDFDLPWHLAIGRVISELRRIPRLDPLSQTHHPIAFLEPVTDLPLYWLAKLGGAAALQIVGASIGVCIGYVCWQNWRRFGPIAYAASGLALSGIFAWLVVRPATLSFLLIALELGLIELHQRCVSTRTGKLILLFMPLGTLLWANAHGFARIGAGLFVVYGFYRLACRLARGKLGGVLPLQDGVAAVSTSVASVVALVASTMNVAGFVLRLGPNRFGSNADSAIALATITEFAQPSLDFYLNYEPLGAVVGVTSLLALAFGRCPAGRWNVPTAFDVCCLLAGVVGLVWMVRTVPLAVLIMTPMIARRLGALVPPSLTTRWSLASCSWLAAGYALIHVDTRLGFGFEKSHFPEQAVRFIEHRELRGRMWNFAPFGGYLAWRLYPKHLVFIDGRNGNAYDMSLVHRARASLSNADALDSLVGEFDMQFAVTSAKEGERFGVPFAQSSRWTMVHFDDVAAVYVQSRGINASVAKDGYRILRHLTHLPALIEIARTGGRHAQALHDDGRLAVQQDPLSPRAAFIAACGALAIRDCSEFVVALQRLALLSPGHPSIQILSQLKICQDLAPL